MKKHGHPLIAEIVSVGTELLLGELVDTNAAYLARQLRTLGYQVYNKDTVGDNKSRLAAVLRQAVARSDVVVLTGGLGPTLDDLTREAIAEVVGEELVENQAMVGLLEAMFRRRGRPMVDLNRRQALMIPSARALDNPRGTAWGWWVETEGKHIIAMPGPPGEMERMWNNEVRPRLPESTGRLFCRTFHTLGVGESLVAETLGDLLNAANPSVATYARDHGVDVRLAASGRTIQQAQALTVPVEDTIRALLGDAIYGIDEETLPGLVGDLLQHRGETIAVMEGSSAGSVAGLLGETPGISCWFRGSLVVGQDQARRQGWFHAKNLKSYADSLESEAREMARAIRAMMGTTWGLATSGRADPDDLTIQNPPVLAFAVVGPNGAWSEKTDWPGSCRKIRSRLAYGVLGLLWRILRNKKV